MQPPQPPGCRVLTVADVDNDGFATFDLDAYFIQFRIDALSVDTGYDLSGYIFEFYPSEIDYNQGTNLIMNSPYTNVVSYEQTCFMKFIYSGTGPFYNPDDLAYFFTCHKLETTPALTTTNQTQNLFQVYPNPVSDLLHIKTSNEANFLITIFELNGRLLMEKQNTPTIDLSMLQNGIYLLNITSKGKKFTQKIMVVN